LPRFIYAIRMSFLVVIETNDLWINEPRRFNASSLRSRDLVAPVIFASSGSLGRDMNVVDGVRPFRPAIRYGRESSEIELPELARRLGGLLRNEAGK
jgi:hypothetical protein